MAIAFFDLDRTLLGVNSGRLWIDREMRLGFLSRWQALRGAAYIGTYHFGFTRLENVLAEAIAVLAGATEAELVARTEAFYVEEVASTYRPLARAAVEHHRQQGHVLALLTSSTNYLCAPVQRELGIELALCNRLEVADGQFTGKPDGALCFGAGKVTHARQLAESLGESLADATFYTDSMSDLPMLDAVGFPVAVNPDPRLRRLARQRGWPVVDWGQPKPDRGGAPRPA